MFLKQNIPKIKHLLKSVPLLLVTLAITLSITPIQVHADNLSQAYDNWAASIVDSQGVNSSASTTTVPYGVSTSRTGYLCYLLDKNGNKAADFAVAYKSPGFEFYDGSTTWIAESRKGGYKVNIFKNEPAPWNCTPWTAAGDDSYTTNEPQIKAWFESMDGNVQNAAKFIADNWGHDMSLRFGDEEVYLVIETLMHFRYSKQTSSTTQLTAEENFRALKNRYMGMPISQLLAESPTAVQDAFYNGIIYDDEVRGGLIKALQKRYDEDPSQFEPDVGHKWYCISGNLVGTVPNLIEYRNNVLQSDTRVFNKFTHKIAPFAEYIQQGNIGSQIGFLPWSGDTSNQITDSDVLNYGVAMMVISARPSGQTTCDESKLPAPHAAPKESEGNVSIIKSYRTRQGTKYTPPFPSWLHTVCVVHS